MRALTSALVAVRRLTIADLGDGNHRQRSQYGLNLERASRSGFCDELLKQREALAVNLAAFGMGSDQAIRLVDMAAIGEPAQAEEWREFLKASFQTAMAQMMEADFLHARAVDDGALRVDTVQARKRRGVLAGLECHR